MLIHVRTIFLQHGHPLQYAIFLDLLNFLRFSLLARLLCMRWSLDDNLP